MSQSSPWTFTNHPYHPGDTSLSVALAHGHLEHTPSSPLAGSALRPLNRDRQHLQRTRSIPARYRNTAIYSLRTVNPTPDGVLVMSGHRAQNQTSSLGKFFQLHLNLKDGNEYPLVNSIVPAQGAVRARARASRMMSLWGQ